MAVLYMKASSLEEKWAFLGSLLGCRALIKTGKGIIRVALFLLENQDVESGLIKMSVDKIAEDTRVPKNQVNEHLRDLKKNGYIKRLSEDSFIILKQTAPNYYDVEEC